MEQKIWKQTYGSEMQGVAGWVNTTTGKEMETPLEENPNNYDDALNYWDKDTSKGSMYFIYRINGDSHEEAVIKSL